MKKLMPTLTACAALMHAAGGWYRRSATLKTQWHGLFFALATVSLGLCLPQQAIGQPISVVAHQSSDITVSGIKVNGITQDALNSALGADGFVSVFGYTGRQYGIDPYTTTSGAATAAATVDLTINGAPINFGNPTSYLPAFVPSPYALSTLMTNDHFVGNVYEKVEAFSAGDSAVASSAPGFQFYVKNDSANTIVVDFQYTFTQDVTTFASGLLDPGVDWGFAGALGIGAGRFNGVNFGTNAALSGAFNTGPYSHCGHSSCKPADFFDQYVGVFSVEFTPYSLTTGGSYTPTYIHALINLPPSVDPVAAIPEPETYAMLLAGLGLIGFTARRKKQSLS